MKKITAFYLILFFATNANAKVWRINNTPGVTADFTSGAAALASVSVVNDDTLYFEPGATNYTNFTLSKRLVIIGAGYFLGGANSNPGLQANPNSAFFSNNTIILDSTSSGSVIMGLDNLQITPNSAATLGSATDNITITRCGNFQLLNFFGITANSKMTGWKINKCYLTNLTLAPFVLQNWEITNNIITGSIDISNTGNLNNLVRNNVFRNNITMYNGYFSNNIITPNVFTLTNVTIKNNISTGNNLPVGNGNVNNSSDAVLFQGLAGNSTDGQWRLKIGTNPAIGGGETLSAITPDCGAYGTADPYVLSGIPAIPTIYLLTVPSSVASNAATMPITISTKSNN